jgi:hypothetical protein
MLTLTLSHSLDKDRWIDLGARGDAVTYRVQTEELWRKDTC